MKTSKMATAKRFSSIPAFLS